jgi:gliding motility-associated-like protein
MAIINTMTGVVQSKTLLNSTTEGSMGLVTLGDGYLYQCDKDKIYRIDPVTMIVDPTPFFDFKVKDLGFSGLCSYTEHCNAPICNAEVSIDVLSGTPYCSAEGVQLFANGKNIRGQAIYEWTMPDKTKLNVQSVTAMLPGTYYVQYYGVTDICGAKDSIVLEITKSPAVNLGPDQMLCDETTIELAPQTSDGNLYFVWSDGSTQSTFTVTIPGAYTVEVSNSCGYAKDTILIASASVPQVDIGMDTTICPGSAIKLSNMAHKQAWDAYRWSDQSPDNNMTVYAQGVYWLESANTCGIARDSVMITWKDSCTCFPLYPQVDLGPDLEMCDYDSVRLMSSFDQEGYRYRWINSSREENMVANKTGMYWLEVSTYCGTVRDSIVISYKSAGCERIVYIPTAFTPNNDGKNDIFKPLVFGIPETYEFNVYNRFGQIVFQTRNILKGWDGSFNGKIQDQNMFVWTCAYRFSGQDYVYRKGSVILIR